MKKLFKVLIGATPAGRHTEQHDVFFGIGENLKDLVPAMKLFWPEAAHKMHIDAFMALNTVGDYEVKIVEKTTTKEPSEMRLFFINLGGYKPDEFEEFHYKIVVAAKNSSEAIQQAKQTAFYKHTGFPGANSHIDDKYGIDVDDLYAIEDILPQSDKEKYTIILQPKTEGTENNEMKLGYFKMSKIEKGDFESE
jgi:hypothetical protein